jgi:hypothetical protein
VLLRYLQNLASQAAEQQAALEARIDRWVQRGMCVYVIVSVCCALITVQKPRPACQATHTPSACPPIHSVAEVQHLLLPPVQPGLSAALSIAVFELPHSLSWA